MNMTKINPYIIGRPIHEKDKFYGQGEIFSFIRDQLGQCSKIILLQGQRRIGKTSVLKQIPRFLEDLDDFVFIKVSLEDKNAKNIRDLFCDLATEISDYIQNYLDTEFNDILYPKDNDNLDIVEWFEQTFITEVHTTFDNKNIVLMLDEYDHLYNIVTDTENNNFYQKFHSIVNRDEKLFIIPVIGKDIEGLSIYLRDSLRATPKQRIGLLDRENAKRLIIEPAKDILEYEAEAIKAILELSANHPYFTQVLCYSLFSNARAENDWVVTSENVEDVTEQAISLSEAGLVSLYESLSIHEQVAFSTIAHSQNTNASTKELEILEDKGVSVTVSLKNALENLEKWGFIETINDLLQAYQLKIEFVRRWLVQNSLIEVISKLENSEPEANKLYQEANNIEESDINGKIDIYGKVLNCNPNHFSTKLELAELYFKNDQFDLAIKLYENFYKFRPGKVQNSLCEARLQYARVLEGKADLKSLEDAAQQLRKIFELQPKNEQVKDKLEKVEHDIHLLKDNPFNRGRPVEPLDFILRQEYIDKAFDQIKQNSNCLFYGSPGMGKSSLLKYLVDRRSWTTRNENIDDYYILRVDCELIEEFSVTNFWKKVLTELSSQLIDDANLRLKIDDIIHTKQIITQSEIEPIFASLNKSLVLLIDNYDFVFCPKNDYTLHEVSRLLRQLRSINDHRHLKCSTIMTCSQPVKQLVKDLRTEENLPYDHLMTVPLKPFHNSEMAKLWERMPNRWKDKRELQRKVENITGGHPALFQIICYNLYYIGKEKVDNETREREYEELEHQFYDEANLMLERIWKSLSEQEQGILLLVILYDLGGRIQNTRYYDLSGINKCFREQDSILKNLKLRKILKIIRKGIKEEDIYDLTASALKKWAIDEIILKHDDDAVKQREKVFLFVRQQDIDMMSNLFDQLWKMKGELMDLAKFGIKEILPLVKEFLL